MCFGGGGPQVEYTGPSAEDVLMAQNSVNQYRSQMQAQQQAMTDQLNAQIKAANEETERVRAEFAAEEAAATAAAEAAQQTAYVTSAELTDSTPEGAQTTKSSKKKTDSNSTLKINTGGAQAQAGAGLNIGV